MPTYPLATFSWGNVLIAAIRELPDKTLELDIKWGNKYTAKCSADQLFRYGYAAISAEGFRQLLEGSK